MIIIAYLFIALLFYSEYHYESSRTTTTLQTSADDKGTTRLLFVMYVLTLLLSPVIALYTVATLGIYLPWIGIAVIIVSVLLLRWTTYANPFYLRAMATTDDHFICTDGPYRLVRHPGYMAFILGWIGFALVNNNWIVLCITLIIMIYAYIMRIMAEEQMMLERFGVDYQQYMDETYRLIPYVF
ncbi:phospholipid methyltransferase-domain-containing protein [Pilobolus umbonatus]|nr:phospholipid methyltransferase-domain-containing protein [Pilobolus umbonatus]